ncbi:class-III pyridoxal-phosphate-dependent aminotransferase [Maribellus maritimus]|uniref:class-III pyridoxal-phosphate-dependent aminotransferase n=1 Tax=Maribellus maritimus TaxID=2870838 RepID=UPI001EEB6C0A|nr:aspartate aminotransferase family protein [Maribellus maritimus]MCG6188918.1 aspartate aminotransferase family protein [Maribellus maritimus]
MIIQFYTPFEKYLEKSEDCYLYDTEGKKYIDFESGVWCANLGHNHPKINHVVKNQLEKSIHQGYFFRNRHAEKLSEKIAQKTELINGKSVFLSSGSEAVNLAITLAKQITGRNKILTTDISYLSAYGDGQNSQKNNNLIVIPFNNSAATQNIDFSQIAALVIETGGASLGIIKFPDFQFIQKLAKQAKQNGVIVIANEVTTGMGRTGKWFGFQHYNVLPDMVTTGKALGNGYPVSAVSVSKEIAKEFEDAPFRYAQSHQNDPLGCAVALEVFRIMEEENHVEKGALTGVFFKKELEKVAKNHSGTIKEIRARGMMLALEFQKEINSEKIHSQLFDNGFVTGNKFNTLRFMPPLTLPQKDINQLIKSIKETLQLLK